MLFLRLTSVFVLGLLLASCSLGPSLRLPEVQIGSEAVPLELSGRLQHDLRLSGVVHVTGDLLIPAGRSLLIEAGTQLLIVGNSSSKIDPEFLDNGTEILVRGSLRVAGTLAEPVVFKLAAATPPGENWTGLELVDAETVELSHVDIIGAETGILNIGTKLVLEQVNILGSRYALLLQAGAELVYRGGRISGGDAGLLCFDQSVLQLKRLLIIDNLEEGLYLAAECSLEQQGLRIERNDLGLVALESRRQTLSPLLHANRIDFKALPGLEQPK